MLFIFLVMGLGAYGFNSKWLAHELDHDRKTLVASVNHDHAPQLDAQDSPDPEPLNDSEHKLFHAFGHFEPVPSSISNGLGEPPARTTPLLLDLPTLPSTEPESPFRPPRTLTLI